MTLEAESYLLDIAARVLSARDPDTGNPLVEMILDQAGQKGTGKWTAQSALDLGVPIPTIAAAIDARILSGMKGERVTASTRIASGTTGRVAGEPREMTAAIHDGLRAAVVCAYAQGMSLLRTASSEYGWGVNLREIARIWKGGCIIRARLLDTLMHAFERMPDLPNLLLDVDVRRWLSEAENGCRRTVSAAVGAGIPVAAMSAAIAYFDSYRSARLPQNLTQAQRDFFGAHTYQRVDRPDAGFVHTDWRSVIERSAQGKADERAPWRRRQRGAMTELASPLRVPRGVTIVDAPPLPVLNRTDGPGHGLIDVLARRRRDVDEEHDSCERPCVRHGRSSGYRRWTNRVQRARVLLLRLQVQGAVCP